MLRRIHVVWQQAIDVNGDGRVDIVDAADTPYKWIVYLNTPSSAQSGVKWERRVWDMTRTYQELASRGMVYSQGGWLPLSGRVTGNNFWNHVCLEWVGSPSSGHYEPSTTHSITTGQPSLPCNVENPTIVDEVQRTWAVWELRDVNGDGYPDVVFNSSKPTYAPEALPTSLIDPIYAFPQYNPLQFTESPNHVWVGLNVRGNFISGAANTTATDPFSAWSVLLFSDSCGLGQWSTPTHPFGVPQSTSRQLCGLADVNGDGLVDRMETGEVSGLSYTSALLGTGLHFNTVRVKVPDNYTSFSKQDNTYKELCIDGTAAGYPSEQTTGLRDLTGDGIPDLVHKLPSGDFQVNVGTGAGFVATATPIQSVPALTGPKFDFSRVDELCDGFGSDTNGGLYDVDGDGKPERLRLVTTGSAWVFQVWQLSGGSAPGNPEAGRIVRIDNGYGAQVNISYRSAKEDITTKHQVPFPEVVVSAISTVGTENLGGSLAETQYAYGNIELIYDSIADAFRPTGYLRRVDLTTTATSDEGYPSHQAHATITDRYELQYVNTSTLPLLDEAERFGRYLRAGQISDVTVLAGTIDTDAWSLLTVDLASDPRKISSTNFAITNEDTRWFNDTIAYTDDLCKDIAFPYDFDTSVAQSLPNYNPCSARGFLYTRVTTSWRGTSGFPSANHVATRTHTELVDDYGRRTRVRYENDMYRTDDDICVDVTYAVPTGVNERVLSAPGSRKAWACNGVEPAGIVYAEEAWEYDYFLSGANLVSQGLVTAHTVYRHATDTGAYLGTVREFDAAYDTSANLLGIGSTREDEAQRWATIAYDEFGLAPLVTTIRGSLDKIETPELTTSREIDPVSGQLLSTTDPNGTVRGATFDGFGRLRFETIHTPDGSDGVLASRTYLGFATNDPPTGRRVVVKEFTEPVPPSQVATSYGRTGTTFFDELGRPIYSEVELGADYGNENLITGRRRYDRVGRVLFEADPYPTNEDPSAAYGTTKYFDVFGTPWLQIRGRGFQPFNTVPDAAEERFPTLFEHGFANNEEAVGVRGPDALTLGSPQFWVVRQSVRTAIGRVLRRSTHSMQYAPRELATFDYDRLGNQTRMVRYQNPGGTNPVEWSWQFDSLGRVLALAEPSSALQQRTYSDWGELKEVIWSPPSPEPSHRVVKLYDALGRTIHSQEQNDGIVDPDTLYNYIYDDPGQSPVVEPTYVLGRLSAATGPTGSVVFSYDGKANINSQTHVDSEDTVYVEQHGFYGDGSRAWVELNLPDKDYNPERVEYSYDTAGRLRSMSFDEGPTTQDLYYAEVVDPWGRLRFGLVGNDIQYAATYAEVGRRLPVDFRVSRNGGEGRYISFGDFDPMARELSRFEEHTDTTQSVAYDALGRLKTSSRTTPGSTVAQWGFTYDPLGNVQDLSDQIGNADAALTYLTTDRDRICRINYAGIIGGGCNVVHDSLGSVVEYPTRTGTNTLTYFNSGAVRTIENDAGARATFRYGPTGGVQELDIEAPGPELVRSDRRYGAFITKRYQKGPNEEVNYLSRQFPGPGVSITRRGPDGPWVFQFSELRGTRFTADREGSILQDLHYEPYGETSSEGSEPGTLAFSTEQWNEGDALEQFGLVHLGARVYDPVIGRFLSRDPLLIPRTSATSNPYAFAFNDPVNFADPSGLDPDPCGGCGIYSSYYWGDSSNMIGSAVALGAMVLQGIIYAYGNGAGGSSSAQSPPNPVYAYLQWVRDSRTYSLDMGQCFGMTCNKVRQLGDALHPFQGDSGARDWANTYVDVGQVGMSMVPAGRLAQIGIFALNGLIDYAQGQADGPVDLSDPANAPPIAPSSGHDIGPKNRSGSPKGSGPGPWCFAAGTQVLMADGTAKSIENIVPGDWVLADDPLDNEAPRARLVTNLQKGSTYRFFRIYFGGSGAFVEATASHPFWTERGWVAAEDLAEKDVLVNKLGNQVTIDRISIELRDAATYNLAIDGDHTYFVVAGLQSVLVHNVDPWDILFTQGSYSQTFSDGPWAGRTVEEAITMARKLGRLPDGLELEAVRMSDGRWATLNNRTLAVARGANLLHVHPIDAGDAGMNRYNRLLREGGLVGPVDHATMRCD